MKVITLKQYAQVSRTIALDVPDNCTELEAAQMLDKMPMCINPNDALKMPGNVTIVSEWDYVSDMGIENDAGEVVLNNA